MGVGLLAGIGAGGAAGHCLSEGIKEGLQVATDATKDLAKAATNEETVVNVNHFQSESLFDMNELFVVGVFFAAASLILLTASLSHFAFGQNGYVTILVTILMTLSCAGGIVSMALPGAVEIVPGANVTGLSNAFQLFTDWNVPHVINGENGAEVVLDPASIMMFISVIFGSGVVIAIIVGLIHQCRKPRVGGG